MNICYINIYDWIITLKWFSSYSELAFVLFKSILSHGHLMPFIGMLPLYECHSCEWSSKIDFVLCVCFFLLSVLRWLSVHRLSSIQMNHAIEYYIGPSVQVIVYSPSAMLFFKRFICFSHNESIYWEMTNEKKNQIHNCHQQIEVGHTKA